MTLRTLTARGRSRRRPRPRREVVWTIVVGGGQRRALRRAQAVRAPRRARVLDWSCADAPARCRRGRRGGAPGARPAAAPAPWRGGATRGRSRCAAVWPRCRRRPRSSASTTRPARSPRPSCSGRVIAAVPRRCRRRDPWFGRDRHDQAGRRAGAVVATPPRESLVAVQTPQAFRADVLRARPCDRRPRPPTTPRWSRRSAARSWSWTATRRT